MRVVTGTLLAAVLLAAAGCEKDDESTCHDTRQWQTTLRYTTDDCNALQASCTGTFTWTSGTTCECKVQIGGDVTCE